jgi:hypothetical protein
MKELKSFVVITRFNEQYNWIKKYTDNYIVYNKGEDVPDDPKVLNVPNIGGNQRDIFHFAFTNYEKLPELTAFIQANPFDHCLQEEFEDLLYREEFTCIQYYCHVPTESWSRRGDDGGYEEAYGITQGIGSRGNCKYKSLDDFMNKYFSNYVHKDWIKFATGSQYIVERKQILKYPRLFWENMMNELNENFMLEAHIIERSLYYIFTENLKLNG